MPKQCGGGLVCMHGEVECVALPTPRRARLSHDLIGPRRVACHCLVRLASGRPARELGKGGAERVGVDGSLHFVFRGNEPSFCLYD